MLKLLHIDNMDPKGVHRHKLAHLKHHFIFMCRSLASVSLHFPRLFASGTRSLRLFLWQEDLLAVVRFVHACFAFRSNLLVAVGAPFHQPLVAEQM